MERAADIAGLRALGEEEKLPLVLSCLKNQWLVRGISPDRRNATPTKDYPFYNLDSLDALFEYFRSGPHAIREGVIFERLAFVQQVDMGDEWLVLKREFDEGSGETLWIPFESYSFESIVKSKARFECAVSALLDADPYDIAAIFADGGNASRRQRQGRTTS